jgi:hypothetical protein
MSSGRSKTKKNPTKISELVLRMCFYKSIRGGSRREETNLNSDIFIKVYEGGNTFLGVGYPKYYESDRPPKEALECQTTRLKKLYCQRMPSHSREPLLQLKTIE